MIPSSIVKRAEVLTGGASSTYGADAVAGVVNFIMDTEFTGVRFDGQYSASTSTTTLPGHHQRTHRLRRTEYQDQRWSRRLWLSGRQRRTMAARSTARCRSAPGSTTIAATSWAISAIARSMRSSRTGAISAPAASPEQEPIRSAAARPTSAEGNVLCLRRWRRRPSSPSTRTIQETSIPGLAGGAVITSVQLQPVQLLPASGRAVHRRRVRQL